jgi:hypothetical protein
MFNNDSRVTELVRIKQQRFKNIRNYVTERSTLTQNPLHREMEARRKLAAARVYLEEQARAQDYLDPSSEFLDFRTPSAVPVLSLII